MRTSRILDRAARSRPDGTEPFLVGLDAERLGPFRRTTAFWNWLPAFRAVAEFRGVVRAASALRTSASALSRAVRLLEASSGQVLFRRDGRNLVLTAAGEALLLATRSAMRSVDDVTTDAGPPRGPLRIATTSRLGAVRLLPALSGLRRAHPDVLPSVVTIRHEEVSGALLAGRLDVAVALARVDDEEIDCTPLVEADNAVYCGPAHPLWKTPSASARRVTSFPFAAPEGEAGGTSVDGWPASLSRIVALRTTVIEAAVDACARGELLAVLPHDVVKSLAPAAKLRALRSVPIAKTSLCVVRRRSLTSRRALAEVLVDALRSGDAR